MQIWKQKKLPHLQANIVRQILCMMEGLLPSMKNNDEEDYFTKPREKVEEDSDDEDVKKKPVEVVAELVDHEATDHEQVVREIDENGRQIRSFTIT